MAAGSKLRASDRVPYCSWTINGTMATSLAGAEAAMSAWTLGVDTAFVFKTGYTYRLDFTGGVFNTDAGGTTATSIVRVRKGVNTTVGQQLLYTKGFSRGGSAISTVADHRYIKNATAADIITSLGVTIQRDQGAAGNGLFGDVNTPLIVTVTRLGLTADLAAGIPGIAASIV